ncbi:type VII secretion integral membrane protein EccD [Gordonia sp. HY002]|uniref:type VII secretion integral membrane protein EccD n=1 Tax=Gordonia zhenghanii TaxID=2911516 RepID=UPI001EF105FF|nr:type VII secretion integral membrane protein EccD [Gordonia zhenghanii]MCF8570397.1 type VII secretion integral membrane protein EccD [Gordonia zhenghanii]MCF8604627.1 type VII secretion integral membrane protein EccD [Gordonia zhenghanii]
MTVVTGSVRISVVGGRTQIDVAAPADVPLAALIPDIRALLHVEGGTGQCWTLAQIGGPPLPITGTLQDADVHDGDLLVLTDDSPDAPGAMVDDVAAGVAALTRESRSEWTADSARWAAYACVLLATVVSAASSVVAATSGDVLAPLLFTGVAAVVCIGAALTACRLSVDPRLCATLSIAACVFGAAAGVSAGGDSAPASIAVAGVAAATLAVIGHRGTGTAPAVHTAIATTGVGAAITGGLASMWSAPTLSIAATSTAIGVLALPLAGRLAIALARLPLPPVPVAAPPTADPTAHRSVVDGVDALGPVPVDPLGSLADLALGDLATLSRTTAAAASYLTGLLAGVGVWIVAAATVTAAVGARDTMVLVYCAVAAAALLVRGRVHTDRVQSTVLILGGACTVAGVAAAAVWASVGPSTAVVVMCTTAALGAAALLVGTVAAGRDFSPLQVRAAEIVQVGVLVALIPLLLWVLDAYRLVREL